MDAFLLGFCPTRSHVLYIVSVYITYRIMTPHASVQVWTRYRTPEFQDQLLDYSKARPELVEKDVSYAIRGLLDQEDDIYAFPLTREIDALSIMDQCHLLLRSKMFSAPLHKRNEDNGTNAAFFYTLKTIYDMLNDGNEWRPLDRANANDADREQNISYASRETLIETIMRESAHLNAMDLLYDARFVSINSTFCAQTGRASRQTSKINTKVHGKDVHMPLFGVSGRLVGDTKELCPCERVDTQYFGQDMCAIDIGVCRVYARVTTVDSFAQMLEGACVSTGENAREIRYPRARAQEMRRWLVAHAETLKREEFICATNVPSDITGWLPPYYENIDMSTSASLDMSHLQVHMKAGVGLGNLEHVNKTLPLTLSEGDRVVHMDGLKNTYVWNALCGDSIESRDVARFGFPAVSMLAESPVVATCVRYIMEVSWSDIVHETLVQTGIEATEENGLLAVLTDIEVKLQHWHARCEAKLTKLDRCRSQSAYDEENLRIAKLAERTSDCPFTVAASEEPGPVLIPLICLVLYNGRLYDPRICYSDEETAGRTTNIIIRSFDLISTCQVVNALDLLPQNIDDSTTTLPLLSHQWVQGIISDNSTYRKKSGGFVGMAAGRDWLFPSQTNHVDESQTQCFDTVPIWPPEWGGAPFGETLTDVPQFATGFSTYMAYITDTNEFAILPNHLRVQNDTSREYGTSGFCREPSFAMPRVKTNTFRVCTSRIEESGLTWYAGDPNINRESARLIQSTNFEKLANLKQCSSPLIFSQDEWVSTGITNLQSSDYVSMLCTGVGTRIYIQQSESTEYVTDMDGLCSQTAEVRVGGGMGETLGDLWHLLRNFYTFDSLLHKYVETSVPMTVDKFTRHMVPSSLDIVSALQGTEDMDNVVRTMCKRGDNYTIHHVIDPPELGASFVCYKTEDCAHKKGEVCMVDGVCRQMQVHVENLLADTIEFGMSSKTCQGQGLGGASPWERVDSLLEQHGFCSYSNTIAHARNTEVLSRSPFCSNKAKNGTKWLECVREKSQWSWLAQNPPMWHDSPGGESRILESGENLLNGRGFSLRPHVCDFEYMTDSDELKMCSLAVDKGIFLNHFFLFMLPLFLLYKCFFFGIFVRLCLTVPVPTLGRGRGYYVQMATYND